MRLAITCHPTPGGSGAVAAALGLELAERGYEVHFVSHALPFRLPAFHPRIRFHEVKVPTYPLFTYPPYELALTNRLVELARDHDLELIHAHYAIPHSMCALMARQVVGGRRLRVVTTLHGTDITLIGADPSFFAMMRHCLCASDAVTAVSAFLATATCETFAFCDGIEVIPNFLPPQPPESRSSAELRRTLAPAGEAIVAHVSNFRPVKRVGDVLRVFARVAERRAALLLLIGEGPETALARDLAQELGLARRVLFMGLQESVGTLLAASDVFLLPSEFESFGLAALEAMGCGVPVVATNAGGLPELVRDGQDGFLAAVGDVETLAERVGRLLDDEPLRRRLGEAARERARTTFAAPPLVDRYEAVYRRVLSGPAASVEASAGGFDPAPGRGTGPRPTGEPHRV